MILADEFKRCWPQAEIKVDDHSTWVLSKPLPGPILWRVRDAIAVLRGKAEAVKFFGQD